MTTLNKGFKEQFDKQLKEEYNKGVELGIKIGEENAKKGFLDWLESIKTLDNLQDEYFKKVGQLRKELQSKDSKEVKK